MKSLNKEILTLISQYIKIQREILMDTMISSLKKETDIQSESLNRIISEIRKVQL